MEEDLEEELEKIEDGGGVRGGRRAEGGDELEDEVEDSGFQVEVAAGSLQGRWASKRAAQGRKSLLFRAP